MSTFNQWVSAIAEAGRDLVSRRFGSQPSRLSALTALCDALRSSRGEAMGTAIADEVVRLYRQLPQAERQEFFEHLAAAYTCDGEAIAVAAAEYAQQRDEAALARLQASLESPLRALFHHINMAPRGTETLVQMRCDLLALMREQPSARSQLAQVERDLQALLILWFNRGFLSLAQISWRTPALILEKLIAYEAVHAMSGWDDLRRRLAEDRRCFAFFHPALEDEPLIFVQVALVEGMASSVQALLESQQVSDPATADTAIFYSISNCQPGLKGISFGNFLIKQVVAELARDLPRLRQFATLSPIPGFRRWLERLIAEPDEGLLDSAEAEQLVVLSDPDWFRDDAATAALQPLLLRLCAHYLANEKREGRPLDAVARFHLGNGAAIARLNWMGDVSPNGMQQSCGILVNYAYELASVETNHEAFVNEGEIAMSSEFRKLLPRGAGWSLFARNQRRPEPIP